MKLTTLLSGLILVPTLLLSGCDNEEKKACENGNILSGKACITLPDGFIKMPEEILKQKYPQAQRPSEAWYMESENGKVSLAFSQTTQAVKASQLPVLAESMKTQLVAFTPKVVEVTVNGQKAMQLEMLTPDGTNPGSPKNLNIMQFSSMNDKLLITTFSVSEDLQDKYLQNGKAALASLVW
ncbi:hypothetical protein I2494_02505 [Budviciaceae bacterium BWR-B9]|uniref:DUF1795 domain-containing protein n=1 Tax=Limnobaculum allomyrinae TaxID=2791986 RepID=A0ABS1ILI6_9GAMM|nr:MULTISPECIES: hypothetical protein [Limnobaculum]MBK5142605.1 hypothetical protein [Limnobaculum allomyrinae]MBV7690509.1 hypothetical protein [Limnobaculum sp. M2-1]